MKANWLRRLQGVLLPALVLGVCGGVQTANAGGFLWISAQNFTYSAAAADSPFGTAYFWALTSGAGTYSFAYAFSDDGAGDSAYAFAEAATGNGGLGAVDVAGAADPYAGVGINIAPLDPSNTGGYPTSKPGSDPFSTPYTDSSSGITFSENDSQMNGLDGLEAFEYTGGTDLASIEALLGVSSASGTSASGDVSDINTLINDFGGTLIPLDNLVTDPGDISSLNFTENTSGLDTEDIILVGEGEAGTPEPATILLFGAGLTAIGIFRRRRSA